MAGVGNRERLKVISDFLFVSSGWGDNGLLGSQLRADDLATHSNRSQTSVVIEVC